MQVTLAAALEGAPYIKHFSSDVLAMTPLQAAQWPDADIGTCGLTDEEVKDLRSRLRGVGVGLSAPSCDQNQD